MLGGFDPKVQCYAGGIDLELPLDKLLRQTDDNLEPGFRAIKMKVGRAGLSSAPPWGSPSARQRRTMPRSRTCLLLSSCMTRCALLINWVASLVAKSDTWFPHRRTGVDVNRPLPIATRR